MSHRWLLTLQDHSLPSVSVSPEDQAVKKRKKKRWCFSVELLNAASEGFILVFRSSADCT